MQRTTVVFTGFIWYGTGQGAVHKNCEKIKKVVDSLKLSCYKEWGEPLKKIRILTVFIWYGTLGLGQAEKKKWLPVCMFPVILRYQK